MQSLIVYNLNFTEKEGKILTDFLKENEYQDSPEGLKKFILDFLDGEIDGKVRGNPILESVKHNPEAIFDIGKMALGMIKRKLKG